MKRLLPAFALLTGLFWAGALRSAEKAGVKEGIAPEAEQFLGRVEQFYKAAGTAQVEVRVKILQELPGEPKKEQEISATLAVSRPNRAALKITASPDGATSVVSDGKTVWTHMTGLKQFMADDAPANLETLFRDNATLSQFTALMGPLADLFRDRPRDVMLSPVSALKLAGTEQVDGVECLRLHGEQEDMDWDAWFESGARPTLKKFVFSPLKGMLSNAPEEMKAKLKAARVEGTVTYSNWTFDGKIADAAFAFEPPKDARKVAQFTAPEPEEAPAPGAPDELKGKPAPDFALDLLGGGKMQLSAHKGNAVVILDFWATWCGPCTQEMPELNALAGKLKDKGVVAYAVNQQEEAAVVKKFIDTMKITLPVAMDAKGDAAKLYRVTGIPQTVVIDKAGNVAAVHVGFGPGFKEMLQKEVEALSAP